MCTYMYFNIFVLNVSMKKRFVKRIMKNCLFIACQIKSLKTLLSFHKYTEQVLDHLKKKSLLGYYQLKILDFN